MSVTINSPFIAAGFGEGPYSSIPRPQLQQMLREALEGKHKLLTGRLEQVVLYNAGEGTRSVTFTRTSLPNLSSYIGELQVALGDRSGRRRALRLHV